jgi:hypothetical protein
MEGSCEKVRLEIGADMKIIGSGLLIAIQIRGLNVNIWIAVINCDLK